MEDAAFFLRFLLFLLLLHLNRHLDVLFPFFLLSFRELSALTFTPMVSNENLRVREQLLPHLVKKLKVMDQMSLDCGLERIAANHVAADVTLANGCRLIFSFFRRAIDDSTPLGDAPVLLDERCCRKLLREEQPAAKLRDPVAPEVLDTASRAIHAERLFVTSDLNLELAQ